jgi:hypothetical protein
VIRSRADLRPELARIGVPSGIPVIVLIGGASGLTGEDAAAAQRVIRDAVVPVAADTGAAVVDGGTDSGVMRMVGEARAEARASFPLVGVVAQQLLDPNDPRTPPRATAEPNHSHMVAVPGSTWGDETPWLFDIGQHIAGSRPVRTVLVNGGPIAQAELEESLRRGVPAIAMRGTGRAADDQPGSLDTASMRGYDRDLIVVADAADTAALRRLLAQALRGDRMDDGADTQSATAGPPADLATLIARLPISDLQRQMLRARWLDQLVYMGRKADNAQRWYYRLRFVGVVGGVLVPALISLSLAYTEQWLRVATFLVSLLVAVVVAAETLYRFGDRWRHYRRNAEMLKSEGWQYLMGIGAYRKAKDPDQAFKEFSSRVEAILQEDVQGYMDSVARLTNVERHDIFTKI